MDKNLMAKSLLLSSEVEYSSFLGKRSEEFNNVEGSGFGYYWFPQCFYRYWNEKNKINSLELWGGMGIHFHHDRVWQFSEVEIDDDPKYRSDIFILNLSSHKKSGFKHAMNDLYHHIKERKDIIPIKFFLVRLVQLDIDTFHPKIFNPDSLFGNLKWLDSFCMQREERPVVIKVGAVDEKYFEKFVWPACI